MRTSFLQYLYLQKPTTSIVIICIISVLPWIGLGDFTSKGEPREASVAVSMLETGDWILPESYANEFAYKPPMAHWLMAAFSLPQGHVSEFTARLPSALAFIILIALVLVFFGKRLVKFQEAFIAVLILITCVETHRAGMTTRVDMLLTTFLVAGLIQLYRWEERLELKGLPVIIPFLLGCATLTKGFVGIILPLFVFSVYLLMLRKYRLFTIIKSLLYIGISSLFLPFLWYFAAWQEGGNNFLSVVIAENFGRFFGFNVPTISYNIGHENGFWHNFQTLLLGFIPWSILPIFALFGMKFTKPKQSIKEILKGWWNVICGLDKVKLFSLVAAVCIVFFYSIPTSKRSVYIMPAYPFIALFLAQCLIYLTEYRTKVTRIFAGFVAIASSIAMLALLLVMMGIIDPVDVVSQFTDRESSLLTVTVIQDVLQSPNALTIFLVGTVLAALITLYYQLFRKINIKILYATIGLTFAINMLIDGSIMRGVKNGTSSRQFAEEITQKYPLNNENIYVMNYLKEYANLYGLNFYLGNKFNNFELGNPSKGYFFSTEKDIEKVISKYGSQYSFKQLETSNHIVKEVKHKLVFYSFAKK